MSTRNIEPRANGEGAVGSRDCKWGEVNAVNGGFGNLSATTGNFGNIYDKNSVDEALATKAPFSAVGSPLVAANVANMTDHTKVYVYVGSESGYTNGNWYYWNGTAWTSGGVYNATALETDKTLTISGAAADSAVVGNKFTRNQYIPNTMVFCNSGGNYSTVLPDMNNVTTNIVYILNVSSDTSHRPNNFPPLIAGQYEFKTITVESGNVILQTVKPYGTNITRSYFRFKTYGMTTFGTWGRLDSAAIFDELIWCGQGASYSTYLPDLNNVKENIEYLVYYSDKTYAPENMPVTDEGMYIFKCRAFSNGTYIVQTLTGVSNNSKFTRTANIQNGELVFTSWSNNKRIITVGSNGDYSTLLEGILAAEEKMNSTVFVEAGTYDVVQEYKDLYGSNYFATETTDYWSQPHFRGIPLGNFVHVIFSTGARVVADLSSTDYSDMAREWFSVFNSGDSEPGLINTGFILENAHIEGHSERYCVHDEHGAVSDEYTNHYINCYMKQIDGTRMCIGGGLGEHGYITIDGCIFESNQDEDTVSYHNSQVSTTGKYKSKVVVKNCYFKNNSIHIGALGTGTEISQMIVTGCKLQTAPQVWGNNPSSNPMNVELLAWNNEIG